MDSISNHRGIMFNKVRGSFVDGYGTRTTIFLKGCPLRCVWCCNPEGQEIHPEIKFTSNLCNGCGNCIEVCPTNAIQWRKPGNDKVDGSLGILQQLKLENDIVAINRELCTNCGKCIDICYTGALDCFGSYVTVDELFDIVKKDEQFYRASGGGVTIGGGEPTFQPIFTRAFLRKCRENYISTALDTCGYTTTSEGLKALDEADLLLYDMKGWDPKKHLSNTGVSNEPILKNIKRSADMRKPIIIRIPVIPGYNDSDENIRSMAEFMSGLKSLERVDLIAYHQYGEVKYGQLGREYKRDFQPCSQEHLDDIKDTLERYGLNVQLGG